MIRIAFCNYAAKRTASRPSSKTADKAVREAELLLITNKYPNYEDFDLVGTRAHVLYSDSFSSFPVEDIEGHFLSLVRFHALQRADNADWQFRGEAISDKDIEHLQGYVRKIKDTRLLQRLKAAVADFYSHRARLEGLPTDYQVVYETPTLAVFRLPHIAEVRHGFHFKDSNEFGIYSVFYADNRDKPYESYYRSDRMCEAESHLDHLRIDEVI